MAAVGIPALLYAFCGCIDYFQMIDDGKKRQYIMRNKRSNLYGMAYGVCSCASYKYELYTFNGYDWMFGFVYGIAKKSLRTAVMVWSACLVNIAYLGISTLLH